MSKNKSLDRLIFDKTRKQCSSYRYFSEKNVAFYNEIMNFFKKRTGQNWGSVTQRITKTTVDHFLPVLKYTQEFVIDNNKGKNSQDREHIIGKSISPLIRVLYATVLYVQHGYIDDNLYDKICDISINKNNNKN